MATQTIKIKLTGSDITLEYDPPLVGTSKSPSVEVGDDVEWVAEGKIVKWVVDFCPGNTKKNPASRRSPFSSRRVRGSGLGQGKVVKTEVGSGGAGNSSASYSYAVAVLTDELTMYALDPDIRVRGQI